MRTIPIYAAAALAEIAGCFAFWAWFGLNKSILWLVPGMASLAAFGCRSAGKRYEGFATATADLLRLPVDVIVSESEPAGHIARSVTKTVPIVTILSGDPVGSGLAQSLSKPGGRIHRGSAMSMSRYYFDVHDGANFIVGDDTAATVEVISDLSRLEALEEQWHALARDIPWPMAQFEWIISAAQAYRGGRLCIITVQEGGVLRAVAPLVLRRSGLTHQLECLDYKLSEPQRLVARDGQYLQLLFRVIQRLRYPFILRGVPANCQDVPCFRTVSGLGLRVVAASAHKDSFVPFDDPGRDLEKRMSASRRKALRYARRAAEKHGPVQFTILRPRPEELPKLLDEFYRVESSGWKGKSATGLQYDLRRASFFRMYCDRMAREGGLRLGFMTIGEAIAAVRLNVVWGNKSWEFKIGYDERFANCSPGLLLSHEALKHGQAEGLLGHHFLGVAEPWHDTWAAEKTDRVTLRYYPATAAGVVTSLQDAGLSLGRSLVRRCGVDRSIKRLLRITGGPWLTKFRPYLDRFSVR